MDDAAPASGTLPETQVRAMFDRSALPGREQAIRNRIRKSIGA